MSDFLAEARIIVRPDTARFREQLEAQLRSVTQRPLPIPVVPVVQGTALVAATAGVEALTVAQGQGAIATAASAEALAAATVIERQYAGAVDLATVAENANTAATQRKSAADKEAAASAAAHARSQNQLVRGAAASGLSLFGLRGATLAASGAFLAGTAAVVGFAKAVGSAAALETELNVFRVTAGATAAEMERVSQAAQALGSDLTLPGVTAGDAAQAMTELAKSGLSVQDSLDGARGVLQLATAAQIDNIAATELVAGALNSFQLAGEDAVKVADLLAGAAKESQGEISDMGTALSQAAAVSSAFGLSITNTVTLLTELAQAGIQGGRAGTSLRVAILRLINPTGAAEKELRKLNVDILDLAGNLRPEIFTDIITAMEGYTKEQRNAALATIFGSDAIRTAVIVGNKGADAFERVRDAIGQQGLASEAAAARTSGFQGDVSNLGNQIETLGVSIGNVAKGPIGALVRGLATATEGVNQLNAAAEGKGFFESFGEAIGDFATSFQRINASFRRGVIGDAGQEVDVFGKIAREAAEGVNALADAFKEAAAEIRKFRPADAGLGIPQLENILEGFDAAEVRARLSGSNAAILEELRRQQEFLEQQLTRDFVKNRPKLRALLEQALLGVLNDIAAITNQAKAEAERVRREAEQAAEARQQALLAAFSLERDQQQNEIARAAQTAGLRDDIREQRELRALVLEQIKLVRERIKDEATRKEALVALQAILIQVNGTIKNLIAQQKETQEAQRQALVDAARLDVEFAQITENEDAEIAARERLIARLKKQQALVKKNTNEWKRLRNLIAQENEAIEELRGEKDKQNNLFAQASFEFLQAQQGFASTLLGNLIPRSATAGLVGGQQQAAAVPQALQPQANLSDAKLSSGPTAGQANATNAILIRILEQLKELNGEQKAPEARRQMASQNSVMDYGPGV